MSELTDEWERVHQETHWGTIPERNFVKFVPEAFPAGRAEFLEIGCGAGAQSVWLAEQGFNVIAVDASPTAVERTMARYTQVAHEIEMRRARPPVFFARALDAVTLAFSERAFDCVVDVCTTQHMFESQAIELAARVHSWLKPGGWFFSKQVMEPFDPSLNRTSYVRFTTVGMLRCMFEPFPVRRIDMLREVVRGDKVVWHMLVKAQKAA